MLALESPKFHRHFVYELCTEILKQHIVLEGEFKFILQHIVEAGTGLANYSDKILIILINIEDMFPSIPNLCPNLCPIYSDELSTRYGQLIVTY